MNNFEINSFEFNKFFVVSFFTSKYKDYSFGLKDSLKEYNVNYFIEEIPDTTWDDACNYKASFIYNMLYILHKPVLWIDIDAKVYSNLDYINTLICDNIDIAFYLRGERELMSGTLFFNNTENAKKVLLEWEKESKEHVKIWDQRNLKNALRRFQRLRIQYLPVGYCYFDLLKDKIGMNKIHIEHFQASRKFNPNHPVYGVGKI